LEWFLARFNAAAAVHGRKPSAVLAPQPLEKACHCSWVFSRTLMIGYRKQARRCKEVFQASLLTTLDMARVEPAIEDMHTPCLKLSRSA
jgi:hypothetical protein